VCLLSGSHSGLGYAWREVHPQHRLNVVDVHGSRTETRAQRQYSFNCTCYAPTLHHQPASSTPDATLRLRHTGRVHRGEAARRIPRNAMQCLIMTVCSMAVTVVCHTMGQTHLPWRKKVNLPARRQHTWHNDEPSGRM